MMQNIQTLPALLDAEEIISFVEANSTTDIIVRTIVIITFVVAVYWFITRGIPSLRSKGIKGLLASIVIMLAIMALGVVFGFVGIANSLRAFIWVLEIIGPPLGDAARWIFNGFR